MLAGVTAAGSFALVRHGDARTAEASPPSPTAGVTQSGSQPTPGTTFVGLPGRLPEPTVGYGSVKIGMSLDSLKTSESVSPGVEWARVLHPADMGCGYASLTMGGTAVVQPDRKAVVAIKFGPGMKTSKDIGIGSSAAEFRAAYPTATSDRDAYRVRVATSIHYEFDFGDDGLLAGIVLTWDKQACFD